MYVCAEKAASVSHSRSPSLTIDKDMSKLLDVIPPWGSRKDKDKEKTKTKAPSSMTAKENAVTPSPPGLGAKDNNVAKPSLLPRHKHTRSDSQSKPLDSTFLMFHSLFVQMLNGKRISSQRQSCQDSSRYAFSSGLALAYQTFSTYCLRVDCYSVLCSF